MEPGDQAEEEAAAVGVEDRGPWSERCSRAGAASFACWTAWSRFTALGRDAGQHGGWPKPNGAPSWVAEARLLAHVARRPRVAAIVWRE